MFTGIIQSIGHITHITPLGDDLKLAVHTHIMPIHDVKVGDSIAVNGVCLTAISLNHETFEAHVSKETLSVTVGLGSTEKLNGFSQTHQLHMPIPVNLEKALTLQDRLGGHLVSGHVDGIGEVVNFIELGDCWKLDIRAPHALAKYIAIKGSICINGVSLTVNSIVNDVFSMNLIPHTIAHTTLQYLMPATKVNIEVDQIARYVERMTEWVAEPV